MAFCRVEGGEEMSRKRGILLGWLQILCGQLSPEKNKAVCVSINSSGEVVWFFKADERLLSDDARRKNKALPPFSSAASVALLMT